ncbi:MAG TPA: RNA degradosome polyphosphate kinase, partial [Planctomycetaceae bacterium]|nr:RNA degradosome polyphosphate kinase [Planctomycetaceae bacterium]
MSAEPRFFNRELSWLEFNQRVLDEARNAANPLLERLKFLAITASNLDEFASVRVGGLKLLCERGASRPDPSGMTPEQQLAAVCARMHAFIVEQYRCLLDELEPALTEAGIRRLRPADLSDRQRKIAELVFEQEVFPILTPIAVPTVADFPPLINQTFNVCVRLAPAPETAEPRFAVIPFGRQRKRFITVPVEQGYGYCPLEDLVGMSVQRFFPGETIEECISFRITRNADL